MACAVWKAAFSSRFALFIVLQCTLWDFSRLTTSAAPVPSREGPSPDQEIPPASPEDRRGSLETDLLWQDSNGDSEKTAGSKKCRLCKIGHYRQSGVRSGIRLTVTARSYSIDLRSRSSNRSKCGGFCQRCSVCPSGWTLRANCTATLDTVCAPCEEGQFWDPVRSRCKPDNPLIHEVVVQNSGEPSPSPLTSAYADPTQRAANPGGRSMSAGGGHRNKIDQPAPNLTEEAKSEKWSAGYIASLFSSAAAGVTVLVLIAVVSIYVWLRYKQWKYERSLSSTGTCLSWRSCFESICKKGSHTVPSDTDYSTANDQNTELQAPLQHDTGTRVNSKWSKAGESKRQTHAPGCDVRGDSVAMKTVTGFEEDAMRPPTAASAAGEEHPPDSSFMNDISLQSGERRGSTKRQSKVAASLSSEKQQEGGMIITPQERRPSEEIPVNGLAGIYVTNITKDQSKTAPSCLPSSSLLPCSTARPIQT